ncbi:MAG: hypothetical protein A2140_06620 [Candidatus Muproteobacteria bacterium RBG_16_62_13]|uniref:Uncharacterized protein n=1 Tax=Candidatus Muproteobacteria bacterium RBG_16_62_13 TaxID=1817756 RepID=A0A1F6T813_9PROT|nr:MAG: hypothetical protein A2140_06620 [Candidatus Muproteobacteria bacterium RBG_16_62_13]
MERRVEFSIPILEIFEIGMNIAGVYPLPEGQGITITGDGCRQRIVTNNCMDGFTSVEMVDITTGPAMQIIAITILKT